MRQFFAIIEETYREAMAKKTIVGFFIFSTVLIVLAFFIFQSSSLQETMRTMESPKGKMPNGSPMQSIVQVAVLDIFYMIISSIIFFFTLCISVFSTTGFITSQMEKGTIDLLISKPVPRWLYILGRYTACTSIVFLESCWFILGLWVAVSVGVGIWNTMFLMSAVYITLGFMGVYSCIVLISILSRSTALSIIGGLGLYFLSWMLSIFHKVSDIGFSAEKPSGTLTVISTIFYYLFPQASDMSDNMTNVIVGKPVAILPIALLLGLSAVYLGLGVYAFSKKEF